jgi:hypothetical protein
MWEDDFIGTWAYSRVAEFRTVQDIAANIRITATTQVNQVFTSQIDRSGDVDWVRVQLQGQSTYQIFHMTKAMILLIWVMRWI